MLWAFERRIIPGLFKFSRQPWSASRLCPLRYMRSNQARTLYSSSPRQTSIKHTHVNADSPPNEPIELELPSPVNYVEKTTPLITETEVRRYIYPLHHRGWTVQRMKHKDGFHESGQESPFLVGQWTFKGPVSARKFLKELLRIEDLEKHHASFNLWPGKRPVFTVMTQTHSARKHPIAVPDNSTEPGITLRDVRLAVLLESFLQESQIPLYNGGAAPSQRNQAGTEKLTWEALLSQYPWKHAPEDTAHS
ncbi:hypothetical protein M413DRAFT_442196 [Hebeloma cylindrosporum]|uniref:4a-hydroxytetrahydrobiopterin dehydratase n=1 Tax=Hebeloma cylindrosporum TaxID=76867 RepID=A0A0C3CNY7_HEBCY|nr:hypothetical protein M413DRAFT_442196 [Hebeloma cylindrosporum h7]